MLAAGFRSLHQLEAHIAVLQRPQQRLLGGVADHQQIFAVLPGLLGGAGGGGQIGLGQAIQLFLAVDQQCSLVAGGLQLGAVIIGQLGDLLVDLAQLLFLFRRQLGTRMDEAAIIAGHQEFLVVIELQRVAGVVNRLHAGEQLFVQQDGVLMRLELGGLLLIDLIQRVVGIGGDQLLEQRIGAAQQGAALVEGDDGVVEGRLFLAVDDGIDLGILLIDADIDRFLEVRVLDLVDRFRAIGQGGCLRERIAGRQLLDRRLLRSAAQKAGGHHQGQRENRKLAHGGIHGPLLTGYLVGG